MKLAFSKACSEQQDINTLLTSFKQTGYDGLQLKGNQYNDYLDNAERFLEDWPQTGTASGLIFGGNSNQETLQRLSKVLNFGSKVGTELIIFCHGVSREGISTEDIKRFARELTEFGKMSNDQGILFSLHNHFDNPVMHREDFSIFFEEIKDGSVGLTIDTAHAVKSGITDLAELITAFGSVINNFHLKDISNEEWRVLGDGMIDFKPVFEAIRKISYNGWISTDEESGAEVSPAMKTCYEFMQKHLLVTDRSCSKVVSIPVSWIY